MTTENAFLAAAKKFTIAITLTLSFVASLAVGSVNQAHAGDQTGIHSFFNDDRNQFVDTWLNDSGTFTVKVSNGRPWRPMWVVLHATFMSGDQVLGKKDFRVYCPSPNPGGGEQWFVYPNPGFSGVTSVVVTTNKDTPWGKHGGGIGISGTTTF